MPTLVRILYTVSAALLVPVIVALLLLFVWSIFELGRLLREGGERSRCRKIWQQACAKMFAKTRTGNPPDPRVVFLGHPDFPGFLGYFSQVAKSRQDDPRRLDHLIARLEINIAGKLSQMTFGARIGPMFGLMGTLIPLGPALMGLSSGNIDVLARNLVVAFSTTVLGLAAGGLFYGLGLIRRRWYAEDMAAIEFVMGYIESPQNIEPLRDLEPPRNFRQPQGVSNESTTWQR